MGRIGEVYKTARGLLSNVHLTSVTVFITFLTLLTNFTNGELVMSYSLIHYINALFSIQFVFECLCMCSSVILVNMFLVCIQT